MTDNNVLQLLELLKSNSTLPNLENNLENNLVTSTSGNESENPFIKIMTEEHLPSGSQASVKIESSQEVNLGPKLVSETKLEPLLEKLATPILAPRDGPSSCESRQSLISCTSKNLARNTHPHHQSARSLPWYVKKPMLKFLLILLSQPEKYSKYIAWVNPVPKSIQNYIKSESSQTKNLISIISSWTENTAENDRKKDLETYSQLPNFGMFTIKDTLSLAVLWATIREKKIVSKVKDGFLRNLRLYYEKKNRRRSDKRTPDPHPNSIQAQNQQSQEIIRPIKQIYNPDTKIMDKTNDTWQFIDHLTLLDFFNNVEVYTEYKNKSYPDIDGLKINNDQFILNNLEGMLKPSKNSRKRKSKDKDLSLVSSGSDFISTGSGGLLNFKGFFVLRHISDFLKSKNHPSHNSQTIKSY